MRSGAASVEIPSQEHSGDADGSHMLCSTFLVSCGTAGACPPCRWRAILGGAVVTGSSRGWCG